MDDKQMIVILCEKHKITNYTINIDGTLNIDGDAIFSVTEERISELPLKFSYVKGHFICCNNNLTTLKGFPDFVDGSVRIDSNKLTSLYGCTKKVGGSFICSNNDLASLEHCPESVGLNFSCSDNKITSLNHFPSALGGNFTCNKNPNIFSDFQFEQGTFIDLVANYHGDVNILDKIKIQGTDIRAIKRQIMINSILIS
jgi:hypothetical protein